MRIVDFTFRELEQARQLALASYKEEREAVPELPELCAGQFPDLSAFAANGLGAAAYEGDTLAGYLCAGEPFAHAFGTTDVTGVFSPMGAHAAARENREKIYAALYAYAAEKWVRAGAVSHGICLYAHDEATQRQFYRYGFGLRCADAIRRLSGDGAQERGEKCHAEAWEFCELPPEQFARVYPFEVLLQKHFAGSPTFMNRPPVTEEAFLRECRENHDRCFAAESQGRIGAYLRLSGEGETFLTRRQDYMHITGAYCLEELRGTGLYGNLLNHVSAGLCAEGYQYLGVDYESINPAADRFWTKHFRVYTHGVVRRIDERIIRRGIG